jgi:pimeloyl-ACP methyl ester carboxylesterase
MTVSRTVVLVHGAWHGSWCWAPVVSRLVGGGRRAITVDLPSVSSTPASLPDDVACVRAALDALDGDALLVGHSYGGVVVTDAGVHPAVAHVAYLCAFALEPGESAGENSLKGGEVGSVLTDGIRIDGDAIWVEPDVVIPAFFHDCTDAVARDAASRLRRMSFAALQGKVARAAWREKPSTYAVCTDDRAIPEALQRSVAARIGNTVQWPTSHSPFLSRPDLVAGLLLELSSS